MAYFAQKHYTKNFPVISILNTIVVKTPEPHSFQCTMYICTIYLQFASTLSLVEYTVGLEVANGFFNVVLFGSRRPPRFSASAVTVYPPSLPISDSFFSLCSLRMQADGRWGMEHCTICSVSVSSLLFNHFWQGIFILEFFYILV